MPGDDLNQSRTRARVAVARLGQGAAHSPRALLVEVLQRSGFWEHLSLAAQAASVTPDALRILIKPDLSAFDRGSPLATDPALVEQLIDLLHDRGYTSVAVGHAADATDTWLANRDALALADLLGYRFVTPAERPYDVVDLTQELVPADFPEESVLHGASLCRAWVEAHFRIGIARSKSHEEYGYALGLHNLLSAMPSHDDKGRPYRDRFEPADLCAALLQRTPLHFSLIDALTSNHGSFGASVPRPLATSTLIAAADPLLADWAGAVKMNEDPYRSPINARVLRSGGLPELRAVDGDLTPYEGWKGVHPLISDSLGRLLRSKILGRALPPLRARVNRELFPFQDPRVDRLNALVAPLYAGADDNSASFAAVVTLHYQLAAAGEAGVAWRTLFEKERLPQREVPLELDLTRYTLADYEAVIGYMESLETLVRDMPADAEGLKYRYIDDSIVFEYSRVLVAPFESFVKRVPIERAVQFMNDYIGGRSVSVQRDEQDRVTHQAERTLFLPQPGFMVLYGGKPIDVGKLEAIRYGEREQAIFWRTVKSSNDSADFDDGIVRFKDAGDGGTRVTIVARQRFSLPLFWQAARLELNPEFKTAVELWAYRRYFDGTLGNFEACYEGREFRIGRPPDEADARAADPFASMEKVLRRLGLDGERKGPAKLTSAIVSAVRRTPVPRETDEHGFLHFRAEDMQRPGPVKEGARAARRLAGSLWGVAREFASGLAAAMRKDLEDPSRRS